MERNWVVIMEGEEKGWEAVQWLSEFEGASPPLSSVACANEPRLRKTSTRGSFAVRQVSAQQQTRKSACAEGGEAETVPEVPLLLNASKEGNSNQHCHGTHTAQREAMRWTGQPIPAC